MPHVKGRVVLYIGAVLLGAGVAQLLRGVTGHIDAGSAQAPAMSVNASYLFLASGEAARLATLPAIRSGEQVLIGVFSDGCVACSGQIDAFLDAARLGTGSTARVMVVLVTDSVGPIDDRVASREFGRSWNDTDVDFFRADRSMARSWGIKEYPALISLVRNPEMRQEFLGAGPEFLAALAR